MSHVHVTERLERILTSTRHVAVLGAHPDPTKPAHFVPAYLHAQGYEIHPVNPVHPEADLWGRKPVDVLADLQRPIDLVDVFRRSEHLPGHLPEIVAMDPLPRVVWLQKGITHEEVAADLREHGIEVVQDACMLSLHKKLGLQVAPTPRQVSGT